MFISLTCNFLLLSYKVFSLLLMYWSFVCFKNNILEWQWKQNVLTTLFSVFKLKNIRKLFQENNYKKTNIKIKCWDGCYVKPNKTVMKFLNPFSSMSENNRRWIRNVIETKFDTNFSLFSVSDDMFIPYLKSICYSVLTDANHW